MCDFLHTQVVREGNDVCEPRDALIKGLFEAVLRYFGQERLQSVFVREGNQDDVLIRRTKHLVEELAEALQDLSLSKATLSVVK